MRLISISMFLLMATQLLAQDWKQMTGDDLFALARKTAFDGNRAEARSMLQQVLGNTPLYHEARVFMARTYYWDNQLDSARAELDTVLSKDPNNPEALSVIIDVEMADQRFDKALQYSEAGLALNTTSEDFLYKKANALVRLDRRDEAGVLLAQLLSIDPSSTAAVKLMDEIKTAGLKNTIGLQYGADLFSRTYRPAHYLSLQLTRTDKWGTGILRFNYANRFSRNGIQGEIDLYPKVANGVYAYLNYGFSRSELFPVHRIGGEIYSRLLRVFEASLGLRYLYFENTSDVTIYTGSVSLYYRNYYFSYRPFVVPSASSNAFSSMITTRRYFRDGDNYLGLTGTFGFSPDERRLQAATGLSSDAVFLLKAQRLSVNWQKTFNKNFLSLFSIGVVRQELSFSLGNYVWITNFSASLRKRY